MPTITADLGTVVPINSAGSLDRRVLHQSTWWFDVRGRAHLIDEMPADYRHNLLRFLWCHRNRLHGWDALSTPVATTLDELAGTLAAGRQGALPHQLDVETWFGRLPLVTRLQQLVGAIPATYVDGNPGEDVDDRLENQLRAIGVIRAIPGLRALLQRQGATREQTRELEDLLNEACVPHLPF